jgi:hypothetical protein
MQTLSVVEAFDPTDDLQARVRPCGIPLRMDQLDLQGLEEAFHRRVVPTVSTPAHRLDHLEVVKELSVGVAGVLGRFNRSLQHLKKEVFNGTIQRMGS